MKIYQRLKSKGLSLDCGGGRWVERWLVSIGCHGNESRWLCQPLHPPPSDQVSVFRSQLLTYLYPLPPNVYQRCLRNELSRTRTENVLEKRSKRKQM